jgi:hypothetical protein
MLDAFGGSSGIGPHNVAVRLVFTQSHKFSLLFFINSIPHNLKRSEEKRREEKTDKEARSSLPARVYSFIS